MFGLFYGCDVQCKSVCAYRLRYAANRIQKIVDSLQGRGHIITDAQGMETLKTMNIPESMSIHIYEEIVETETDGELIEKTLNSVIDTDPIYIMFTSGSTGAPKGVTVPHRGVIDYAIWVAKTFNINENLYLEIKHRSILIIRYLIYTLSFDRCKNGDNS